MAFCFTEGTFFRAAAAEANEIGDDQHLVVVVTFFASKTVKFVFDYGRAREKKIFCSSAVARSSEIEIFLCSALRVTAAAAKRAKNKKIQFPPPLTLLLLAILVIIPTAGVFQAAAKLEEKQKK